MAPVQKMAIALISCNTIVHCWPSGSAGLRLVGVHQPKVDTLGSALTGKDVISKHALMHGGAPACRTHSPRPRQASCTWVRPCHRRRRWVGACCQSAHAARPYGPAGRRQGSTLSCATLRGDTQRHSGQALRGGRRHARLYTTAWCRAGWRGRCRAAIGYNCRRAGWRGWSV